MNELPALSLTTVGTNQVGHLTNEDFHKIIGDPQSPFNVILETGGARFKFLGWSPDYNAYVVGRVEQMEKHFAIWVENIHANFGQCPYNRSRYNSYEEAEKALDDLFSQETLRLLQDAGLYYTVAEI